MKEILVEKPSISLSDRITEVTGLPVLSCISFPELQETKERTGKERAFRYTVQATIGSEAEKYNLDYSIVLAEGYTPNTWVPKTSWSISFNGNEIYRYAMTSTSNRLSASEVRDQHTVESCIRDEFIKYLGGPTTTVPFMDYESYSIEALTHGYENYFANMYLLIMTHRKELGHQMPPILSKRPEIISAMNDGNIEKINKILATITLFESTSYDDACRTHLQTEASIIRRDTTSIYRQKDRRVPFIEAFPRADVLDIGGDRTKSFPPYNILVVEDDTNSYRLFTNNVLKQLQDDGRYGGSQLITDINLSRCVNFCTSGRIDFILFDSRHPNPFEILNITGNTNPFYTMMHGHSQGAIAFTDDGFQIALPNGKLFDQDSAIEEANRLDIRSLWMSKIANACENEDVIIPPYFIIHSDAEYQDIGKIISQKLGNSIS